MNNCKNKQLQAHRPQLKGCKWYFKWVREWGHYIKFGIQILYVAENWTFQNNALSGHICVTLFQSQSNAHPNNTPHKLQTNQNID